MELSNSGYKSRRNYTYTKKQEEKEKDEIGSYFPHPPEIQSMFLLKLKQEMQVSGHVAVIRGDELQIDLK